VWLVNIAYRCPTTAPTSRRTTASVMRRVEPEHHGLGREHDPSSPLATGRQNVVPTGPDWIHEVKWDGYRIVARRHGNLIRLWSRNGRSWTEAFPAITNALRAPPTDSVMIDGEAVCLREDGSSVFNALRSQRTCKTARLMAFDLLFIGGQDLRGFPLEER